MKWKSSEMWKLIIIIVLLNARNMGNASEMRTIELEFPTVQLCEVAKEKVLNNANIKLGIRQTLHINALCIRMK